MCAPVSLTLSRLRLRVCVASISIVCLIRHSPEHKSIPIQPVKEKKSGVEQQQQRLALNVNLPTQPVKEKKSGVEQKKRSTSPFFAQLFGQLR